MSSNPSNWLFDVTAGRNERDQRESFLSLDLFSLTFKYIFMTLLRGAIAPIALSGPATAVATTFISAYSVEYVTVMWNCSSEQIATAEIIVRKLFPICPYMNTSLSEMHQ